jgi:hypothetical protein
MATTEKYLLKEQRNDICCATRVGEYKDELYEEVYKNILRSENPIGEYSEASIKRL